MAACIMPAITIVYCNKIMATKTFAQHKSFVIINVVGAQFSNNLIEFEDRENQFSILIQYYSGRPTWRNPIINVPRESI